MRAADTGTRLPWIDMLRGACVLAVVLMHVNQYAFLPLDTASDHSPVWHAWSLGNRALGVVRMPLLLLISGWLAASKVRAGLTGRTWASITTNAYLYVVWFCLYVALDAVLAPGRQVVTDVSDPASFVRLLLLHDSTPLWFVYGLAVLTLVIALLHRVPAPVMLTGFVVMGAVVDQVTGWYGPMWTRVLRLAVFFAVGVYGRDTLLRLSASRSAVAGCAVLAAGLYAATGGMWSDPPYLVFVVIGVACFVALAGVVRAVASLTPVRAPLQWVGRRTLGVYVMHWPLVCGLAVAAGAASHAVVDATFGSPVVELAYPVVATAAVVLSCLLLEQALRRSGLSVLFRLPRPWAERLIGTETRPTRPPGEEVDAPRGVMERGRRRGGRLRRSRAGTTGAPR